MANRKYQKPNFTVDEFIELHHVRKLTVKEISDNFNMLSDHVSVYARNVLKLEIFRYTSRHIDKISDEQRNLIIETYKRTLTMVATVAELNIDRNIVSLVIKEANIDVKLYRGKNQSNKLKNKLKRTPEDYVEILKPRNITPLEDYRGDVNILHRCDICLNEWKANPGNIIHSESGCPECAIKSNAKARALAPSEYVKRLSNFCPTLEVVEDYISHGTKVMHRCKTCSHEWKKLPVPGPITSSGCPVCTLPSTPVYVPEKIKELYLSIEQSRSYLDLIKEIGDYVSGTNYDDESYRYGMWKKKGFDDYSSYLRVNNKVHCEECDVCFDQDTKLNTARMVCSDKCDELNLEKRKKSRIAKFIYQESFKNHKECVICGTLIKKKDSLMTGGNIICSTECLAIRKEDMRQFHVSHWTVAFWMNKGFSEKDANSIISKIQRNNSPRCTEHWTKKGFSEEDSKKKVSELQQMYAEIYIENSTHEERQLKSSFIVAFWMARGYTEVEAKAKIKNIASNFTLEFFVNKYGETDGRMMYKERLDNQKYYGSLEYAKLKHGDELGEEVWSRKFNSRKYYSQIAEEMFNSIYSKISHLPFNVYFKPHSNEFLKINHKCNFYDFTIPAINYVIEFNGNYWHADPEIYESDYVDSRWNGLTAAEIWENDRMKCEFIKSFGFDLDVIWEEDYVNSKEQIVNSCVDKILKKYEEKLVKDKLENK